MTLPILLLLASAAGHKRAINADYSVLVSTNPCLVRVVYGESNQTYITLDKPSTCAFPVISRATEDAVYIEWFGDYGFYKGTYKYVYNLPKRHAAKRYDYHRFAVESLHTKPDGLIFAGKYNELPAALAYRGARWQIVPPPADPPAPPSVATPGLRVEPGGIHVAGRKPRFYPVPIPTQADFNRLRTSTGQLAFTPGPYEIENKIGPHAFDGKRLWFANTFYDGEGTSGVGAIGSFDLETRRYDMRHLPEIAPWSASALLLDGEDLWIALMRQPEGAQYGAGVLRYNTITGALQKYAIEDLVSTITRHGSTLFFATVHGVYTSDAADRLTHIRIEPGSNGAPRVITTQ